MGDDARFITNSSHKGGIWNEIFSKRNIYDLVLKVLKNAAVTSKQKTTSFFSVNWSDNIFNRYVGYRVRFYQTHIRTEDWESNTYFQKKKKKVSREFCASNFRCFLKTTNHIEQAHKMSYLVLVFRANISQLPHHNVRICMIVCNVSPITQFVFQHSFVHFSKMSTVFRSKHFLLFCNFFPYPLYHPKDIRFQCFTIHCTNTLVVLF